MQWKKILNLFFIANSWVFLTSVDASQTIILQKCTVAAEADQVTLSFIFDDKVKYHCLLLPDPERFVVDLSNVTLKSKLIAPHNAFIDKIRSNDHNHEYLRLVFDLKQKVKYSASASEKKLSITLSPQQKASVAHLVSTNKDDVISKPVTSKEDKNRPGATNEEIEAAKNLVLPPEPVLKENRHNKGKNIVIVIDPGHGGKDPGAAGPRGTVEKEVVLKISKRLQALLNEEPGFNAVLTRTTDCYLPLRKRLAIARKHHADMFIAIHADAYHHSHATGASVYALSQRGATSEAARWLAEKENESELGGLSDELADKDAILRSVLIDLSQTHTIESSLQIGNTLLNNLGKFAPLHHSKVEQAAFVVLKSPDIPSVLVETGFLSNPSEEEKLSNPGYQHQTAYAIKEGIKRYFLMNSPGSIWFSDKRTHKEVVADKDETLPTNKRKAHKIATKIG